MQPSSKTTRKFKEETFYDLNSGKEYFLLPFRFHRLSNSSEIIVNELGDFLILPNGTVKKIVHHEISKQFDPDLYGDLIANFFISDSAIPENLDLMSTRYRTKKSFLDNFTALHIFVITLRCDQACHYCQVSSVVQDKNIFDMSRKHIDKSIEYMMKSPNPYLTMEFQGGESLLTFENIVYAIEKTKPEALKLNKMINYVVCTNLSRIDNEMLSYFKDNNVLISTSLDGPPIVHNQNRFRQDEDSYEMTISGIHKSREILGPDRVSALLTTTSLSLNYPIEIVDEYFSLSFQSIFLRPINPFGYALRSTKRNKYEVSEFLEFYKKALLRIIDYNLQGHFFREDYATIILKKILTPFPVGFVDLQSPSGIISGVVVYNYDGKVYSSDESRMLAEMGDYTFQIGNLDKDSYQEIFYGEKAHHFSEVSVNESLAGCSECAFQSYCGANPVSNWRTQGDYYGYRPTNEFCKRNMGIISLLFELMENDKKIEKVFRSWVYS
jgi:His-Xaa-Ser system radical SAM maturase HxsB